MHVNPDLLALLALHEPVGSADDHHHLAGCAACQDDLAAFETVVGLGRRTSDQDVLLTPPPEVWERIRDELGLHSHSGRRSGSSANGSAVTAPSTILAARGRPGPDRATDQSGSSDLSEPPARPEAAGERVVTGGGEQPLSSSAPPSSSRGLRAASLALAAALALVVGIGLGANLDRLLAGQTEKASVQLNALPPWPGSSGRASVEEDREGNRTLVVTISSPEPPTGPREVWLTNTRADPMVAVGFLRGDSGRFPIAPDVDITEYYLVDISQEPAKDDDPHHSGNSMLRGRLPV